MSNWLKMSQVNTIDQLLKNGWSHRRIARELGVHRVTVARHARRLAAGSDPKATIPTAGSGPVADGAADPKVTIPTAGKSGRASQCEPLRIEIEAKLAVGLSAQRIWQDVRSERDYLGSYESVKRFVRALRASSPAPFRRMETLPGEQAQVDFGQGAPTRKPGCSRLRRPYVLRVVLSCSRKAYSEVVWHQDTESFLRALENAFIAFGGVPETIVVDNLKAAVLEADWFDPTLNPKLEAFARHYGTVILPTKPRMPRHKGKVERGVDYVQENAVKGRVFESIEAQNAYLRDWEKNVADLRIHGTTKKQVRAMFEEERGSLRPLPRERFPMFEETERIVSRDGHIAVAKSFYSAPPEFLGRTVWVRYDSHLVRIFDRKMNEVRVHARVAVGKFSTHRADILDQKINAVERGAEWLLERTAQIGEKTAAYAQALLKERGIAGLRSIQGLLELAHKHPWKELERACDLACRHGQFRLRTLRHLLAHSEPTTEQLEFLDNHPIIRDPLEYGDLVRDAFLNSPVVEGAPTCASP
jgi:transposase